MFEKAKTFMEDHLKAFGVNGFPPVDSMPGQGVSFLSNGLEIMIVIGRDTAIDKVPVVDWMIVAGKVLLHQSGSDIAPLYIGPENKNDETALQVADDLYYIVDLAAIYQCYLQNPVEAYCIYDDAIELKDDTSLHPLSVALGLTHPRGLAVMGFDKKEHQEIFEEADFFKPVITQIRPDLSLLIALQNAWQKQKGVDIRITVNEGVLRFNKAQ